MMLIFEWITFLWRRGRSEKATINLDVLWNFTPNGFTEIRVDSSLTECYSKFNPLQSEFTIFTREFNYLGIFTEFHFGLALGTWHGTPRGRFFVLHSTVDPDQMNCCRLMQRTFITSMRGRLGKKSFFLRSHRTTTHKRHPFSFPSLVMCKNPLLLRIVDYQLRKSLVLCI